MRQVSNYEQKPQQQTHSSNLEFWTAGCLRRSKAGLCASIYGKKKRKKKNFKNDWWHHVNARQPARTTTPIGPSPIRTSPTFWFLNCLQHHQCHAPVRPTSKRTCLSCCWKRKIRRAYLLKEYRGGDKRHIDGYILNMLSFLTFAVVCVFFSLFLSLLNVLNLGKKNIVIKLVYWLLLSFTCKEKWVTNMILLLVKINK